MKQLIVLLPALAFVALQGCATEPETPVPVVADPQPEQPVDDPVEDPVDDPVEDPVDDPVEDPVDDPVEDPVTDPDEHCLTHEQFFQQKVWAPLMSTVCIACHSASGAAKASNLVLKSEGWPGWLQDNMAVVEEVANYEYEGTSILLLKPSAQIEHEGGELAPIDSEHYMNLQELVQRFKTPDDCEPPPVEDSGFFAGVTLLDAKGTYRKAALQLAGRVATTDENAYLDVNGWSGVAPLLDALMTEQAFFERLKEGYNDRLLTDRYNRNQDGINLLNTDDYPDRKWFEDDEYGANAASKALGTTQTNPAVARAPLELIAWVVKNDLPFTEVLTADYTLVNPFSARTFGVFDDVAWNDPMDAAEVREVQLPGIPHAGVLTEPMFLNRFPTTATNRNRHRSRVVWDIFLATDVLALAEQPIDPTSIEDHNPTLFNANCTVCHEIIDPVAGAFQNWTAQGRFITPESGWHQDMLAPGFEEAQIPFNGQGKSLQWLADKIAGDTRFATATVQTVFTMVTGQKSLKPPSDQDDSIQSTEELAARTAAYEAQAALLEGIADEFVAESHNFKSVVKKVVLSPYFRAVGMDEEPSEQRAMEVADVGTARLLTPEALNRKITAVTGLPWRSYGAGVDLLLDSNQYRIFYGGIDSNQVTTRITSPSGVMVAVQGRMANEVACRSTAHDLARHAYDRVMLPYIEITYMPLDENGFTIPQAENAIRENIRYLHLHLLGEALAPGDEELEATYKLWWDTWSEGKAAVASGDEHTNVHWFCSATTDFFTKLPYEKDQQISKDLNYTVRAWTAVVAYLLSDYRFLYE